MPEVEFLIIISSFLLVMLIVYVWASQRNLIKNRKLTLQDYLWRLKQITGKSEYDLFHIAAEEKGWPIYYVEKHFRRYLVDQTLPIYVKDFLEEGKEHIEAYRCSGGDFLDKKLLITYFLFAVFFIGGSLIICLYILPRIWQFDNVEPYGIVHAIETNPKLAQPFINRAVSSGLAGQIEKACSDLKLACKLGYCEEYRVQNKEGFCQQTPLSNKNAELI